MEILNFRSFNFQIIKNRAIARILVMALGEGQKGCLGNTTFGNF
jgi:hypothetical protein